MCKENFPPFEKHATLVATIGLNPVCPSGECFNICEEFNPPVPKQSGLQENINSSTGYKASVYPNPTDGFLNIQLNADTEGEHIVEIFDISGNLVFSKTFSKRGNEVLLQLDLSKFSNVNYNYIIKQNGTPKINGSFNIIK